MSLCVCRSGNKCVCVGVSAARLGFIYSALTKPLHQMGTNRVMEERERKQRGREEREVYARIHSHEDSFVPQQAPDAAWQGDTDWL